MQKAAKRVINNLKGLIIQAFDFARVTMHVEPVFNDAASGEGEGSGGASYHAFGKGILPGVREVSYADGKQNVMLREMRAHSAQFTRMHLSKG